MGYPVVAILSKKKHTTRSFLERTLCLSADREITAQLSLKDTELRCHKKITTIFSHFPFVLIFFVR